MDSRNAFKQFLFHPIVILLVAFLAALSFALCLKLLFDGELEFFLLYYFVPITVPFVAYAFDRAARWRSITWRAWAIEVPVIALALSRGVWPVPFVSGHALFLSYAMLACESRLARILAALVMLQVAYIKIFLWQDWSLVAGIVVGAVTAILFRKTQTVQEAKQQIYESKFDNG